MSQPMTFRRSIPLAAALVLVLLVPASPAAARTYPTWSDVSSARASESAKQTAIAEVTAALTGLEADLAASVAAAEEADRRYQDAYLSAQQAEEELLELQQQLGEAQTTAEESAGRASDAVTGIARSGPLDPALQSLAAPDSVDDTLYRLGVLSRLGKASEQIVDEARADANVVTGLSDQADVAATELEARSAAAEVIFDEAQAAADAANAAVDAQREQRIELEAQLAFLEQETAQVESDYAAGVQAAREEADRRAREAAAAAAAAGRQNSGTAPIAGGSGGSYNAPSTSGWWRPVPGPVTSRYGPRRIICNSYGCTVPWHGGVDMADPCGRPIKAASAGTVVSAKNDGAFGYRVTIDHGGGTRSYYGHMRAGTFEVSAGQQVSGGQVLGQVGDTGVVTGCHIDVKIDEAGASVDPTEFFAARGVTL